MRQILFQIMRNLLGTHLGNSGLFVLCRLIQSNCDAHMIRGGIFFVTSALWGSNKVSSLHYKPAAVLPNLREVCFMGLYTCVAIGQISYIYLAVAFKF